MYFGAMKRVSSFTRLPSGEKGDELATVGDHTGQHRKVVLGSVAEAAAPAFKGAERRLAELFSGFNPGETVTMTVTFSLNPPKTPIKTSKGC